MPNCETCGYAHDKHIRTKNDTDDWILCCPDQDSDFLYPYEYTMKCICETSGMVKCRECGKTYKTK